MSIRNRRPIRWLAMLGLCGLMGSVRISRADPPNPRLDLVFPPGGQAGTAVDVRVSGSGLDRDAGSSHPKWRNMRPWQQHRPSPRRSPP